MHFYRDKWTPFAREFYLGCYFKQDHGNFVHDSILRFKDGIKQDVQYWISLVKREIVQYDNFPTIDYVIRTLGHSELVASPTKSLHLLAIAVANELETQFLPDLFSKTRITAKQSTLGTVAKKKEEIEDVFKINKGKFNLNNRNILIVDDIRTAGVMSGEMARQINQNFTPKNLFLLTLLKTCEKTRENILVNDKLTKNL